MADGGYRINSSPIPLTYFDEADAIAPKEWIIKGVIALGETSSWIAPPGKGKSALLTDISVKVGAGEDWRGYRTKRQCGVVYFAFERSDLVKRRLTAHARRDGLRGLPIAVAGQIIDLMQPKCVELIVGTIRAAEARFSVPVGLSIFDTFAKGIAAGGGDEDKARDQNIVLANLRRVHEQINIHLAIVGHTGKDESRGARGSNAHVGDVDLLNQIRGDVIKTVEIVKGNDQPEGELTRFKLESYELGHDEDGDSITTAILSPERFTGELIEKTPRGRSLSDRQKLALDALTEATLNRGAEPPSSYKCLVVSAL